MFPQLELLCVAVAALQPCLALPLVEIKALLF